MSKVCIDCAEPLPRDRRLVGQKRCAECERNHAEEVRRADLSAPRSDLVCPSCKRAISVRSDLSSYTCSECSKRIEVASCPGCRTAVQWVIAKGQKGVCPFCKHVGRVGRGALSSATVRDAVESSARLGMTPDSWDAESRIFPGLVVLGGYGHSLPEKGRCTVAFAVDEIVVCGLSGEPMTAQYDGASIEVGGPGAITRGGGFFGGGFGAKGAAEGMLVASVLNSVTTKTEFQTVVGITTSNWQLILLSDRTTPDRLRIELAPVFGRIRSHHTAAAKPTSGHSDDLAGQIARLADLHRSGALTEEEFANAKQRLIDKEP